MSAIINALFGGYPEGEQQTINQTTAQQSTVNNECLQTSVIKDDVQVKSVISSETQANATINNKLNIDNLLSQLSTTHAQVDQYSRARTAEINEQVISIFLSFIFLEFLFFLNRFKNLLLMFLLELNVNKKNYYLTQIVVI